MLAGRHPIDAPGTDEKSWAAWPWLSTLPGGGLAGLAGVTSAVVVAAHGTQSDYVRNLQAEPRVRVKARGSWRSGTAVVLTADDTVARSRTLPYQWDAALGRAMGSAPLTIRIDLDAAGQG